MYYLLANRYRAAHLKITMKLVGIILTLIVSIVGTSGVFFQGARVWTRIPPHLVHRRVIDFIKENRINNCYDHEETPTLLLLKCWRDNKLVDIEISISPAQQGQRAPIKTSVSVYI